MLKFMHNLLPMHEWACFRPAPLSSDFKTLPAETIWERVQDTQVPFLIGTAIGVWVRMWQSKRLKTVADQKSVQG